MRYTTPKSLFSMLVLLLIVTTISLLGQTSSNRSPGPSNVRTGASLQDTAGKIGFSGVEDVAKRVDSLQFIVVYNAELLRRDLDQKVVWIYVMLGVMIIASMMMYGALNQAQRQRKELEEKVFSQLSTSVAELEAQIKSIEAGMAPPKPEGKSKAARKKK